MTWGIYLVLLLPSSLVFANVPPGETNSETRFSHYRALSEKCAQVEACYRIPYSHTPIPMEYVNECLVNSQAECASELVIHDKSIFDFDDYSGSNSPPVADNIYTCLYDFQWNAVGGLRAPSANIRRLHGSYDPSYPGELSLEIEHLYNITTTPVHPLFYLGFAENVTEFNASCAADKSQTLDTYRTNVLPHLSSVGSHLHAQYVADWLWFQSNYAFEPIRVRLSTHYRALYDHRA